MLMIRGIGIPAFAGKHTRPEACNHTLNYFPGPVCISTLELRPTAILNLPTPVCWCYILLFLLLICLSLISIMICHSNQTNAASRCFTSARNVMLSIGDLLSTGQASICCMMPVSVVTDPPDGAAAESSRC